MPVPNPWTRKLEQFDRLPEADRRLLDDLISASRRIGANQDLAAEGEVSHHVHVVLEGCACRYRILPDGRRQITAYLLPGDICDLHVLLLTRMDYSVGTLVPSMVASIPRTILLGITERHPKLTRALWWNTFRDEAIAREWIVMLGRRSAYERLAHLFCELLLRLRIIGAAGDESYVLPVTQAELADTLGLSLVHVNRSLQRLRHEGLIVLEGRSLTITDSERLMAVASFNPSYLHPRSETGRGPPPS